MLKRGEKRDHTVTWEGITRPDQVKHMHLGREKGKDG